MAGSVGVGPACPVNNMHGRLYLWEDGKYFCPTNSHGGNGRFFTEEEATGEFEANDRDMADLYRSAARRVMSGLVSLEQAVQMVSRQTGQASSVVRENINLMITTVRTEGESMAEKRQKAKAERAAKTTSGEARESRPRKERASAEDFKAAIDARGFTNKQAAEAALAAGLGGSATYIYILTHKGASRDLLEKFTEAMNAYEPPAVETAETEAEAEPVEG